MADLDDQPAEFSELDLSEDAAITGEDVEDVFVVNEGASEVRPDPAEEEDAGEEKQ